MPHDARARLEEGIRALWSVAVQDRQLTRAQTDALARAKGLAQGQGCLTLFIAILFLPLTLLGLYLVIGVAGQGNIGVTLLVLSAVLPPIVVLAGMAWLSRRLLKRPVERLRSACAATPPARAGEPAGCHVCGGPVATGATNAIARCVYCGADNLVDSDSLRAGALRRGADVGQIAAGVQAQARALGSVASGGVFTSIASVFLAPVASIGCAILAFVAASHIEVAPQYGYVLVTSGNRHCLALVDTFSGHETVSFNHRPPPGFPNMVTDGRGERIAAAKLPGRALEDGRRIVRVVSHLVGWDELILDRGEPVEVTGVCLRN